MAIPATPIDPQRIATLQRAALAASRAAGFGVYLGHSAAGWCFARPQQSVMILGPPRSGKTASLMIPNVLTAGGPVVSTSTKPDVLDATGAARARMGRCWLFDPTGSVERTGDLEPLRWSPLQACGSWNGAVLTARSLVDLGGRGTADTERSHWAERAQSLLAPLLHAAALDGATMRTLLRWVDRRQAVPAQNILAASPGGPTELAFDVLSGIVATDERELSGIWSTASGALAAFRTHQALAVTDEPDFDASTFVRSTDTIYVAAPAHRQALAAPLVVGLIDDVRQATYAYAAAGGRGSSADPPVLLALDEVANIAPLPDLPAMISEGGGQGLVTVACLQDLSQARRRWDGQADGFPSLFGTTVVLPGIGDVKTLEALAALAGEEELPARSVSTGRTSSGHPFGDLLTGGRLDTGESASTQWRPRLPADMISRGSPGHALAFDERNRPAWVPLAPAHLSEPWLAISHDGRARRRQRLRSEHARER